ncbi:hypothetical protein [Flavobacterium sp.]|uniref:hypothetical protein n=1 Tax=Flavobacterium sp. TaxID=239 RepID=UPI00286A34B1|nr:hypothetical protein [Flavobacterium sp.]
METLELRKKIIQDFDKFIQDDSKLEILEGVFDSINSENIISVVPDSHYNILAEAREKYLSGIESATSWDEMEQRLNQKYGF